MRLKQLAGVLAACGVSLFTGCGGFFSDPNSTTTGTATGSTSGDYIYVVNQTTDSLSGFSLATGSLVAVSGSPYALTANLLPSSVTVSRPNTYVFVGGNGAIYCYSIGTGGALTAVNGGGTTTTSDIVSMTTSPDGQWLIALSESATAVGAQIAVYNINTSTGALTAQSTVAITFNSGVGIGTVVPKAVRITANGDYLAAALGTAGDAFFTFNTTTGVPTQVANVVPATSSGTYLSDNAITFNNASSELFIATNGIVSGGSYITAYPINSNGSLGTPATIATGNTPSALQVDSTGAYLYSSSFNSGQISGYSISASGTLTALSTSPYAASPGIGAIVRDQSGLYMLATSSSGGVTTGANDVTLYGFDAYTKGQLDPIETALSGTDPAGSVAIAATH